MKRNKKLTITALVVMFMMALAVSVLTFFSFADDSDNPEAGSDLPMVTADAGAKTIIDYIVENSYKSGDGEDPVYRVVEVGSGSNPSKLKQYVEAEGRLFENEVFNGHIENAGYTAMNAEVTLSDGTTSVPVIYSYFNASEIGNKTRETENSTAAELFTNRALATISNADFIYVSIDPSKPFSPTNDLSEDLYGALVAHATTNFRPFVIDSPTQEDDIATGGANTRTLGQLATNVFAVSGQYYYTFGWNRAISVEQFLSHQSGSLYLGIRGDKRQDYWMVGELGNGDGTGERRTASKVLVLTTDPTIKNTTMLDAIINSPETPLVTFPDLGTVRVRGSSDGGTLTPMAQWGYNGRYPGPDAYYIERATIDQFAADTYVLNEYDMIIIETTYNSNSQISLDAYKKLVSAMYANVSIVYDAALAGTGGSGGSGSTGDRQATNFLELYYDVAYADNTAKDDNILITNRSMFEIILDSGTGDVLADLINKCAFRSIGGRGSSSSDKFTVLELQPCYPIDEDVAIAVGQKYDRSLSDGGRGSKDIYGNGNYYTSPADVQNGVTKEEIDDDTEYYAWELSKAKIVDAIPTLNSVDEVNLVQMSTEEFAASKTTLLGNYDMIYIGGNTSALKAPNQYMATEVFFGGYTAMNKPSNTFYTDQLNKLPIYAMYTHVGDLVQPQVIEAINGEKGHKPANGESAATITINGTKVTNTISYMSGNDITYDKKLELIEYVNAGYPVVVADDVATAYEAVEANGYLQNFIDPDSRMAGVLAACHAKAQTSTNSNVLWGFDKDATIRIIPGSTDKSLGNTKKGYVVVFNDGTTTDFENQTVVAGDKDALVNLYTNSQKRVRLIVTKEPKAYNLYDPSSLITDSKLSFTFEISGSRTNTAARLYIDDDGNSTFSASEIMVKNVTGNELTHQLSTDFAGPIYWKLEIYDTTTNRPLASKTGISYVQNATAEKAAVSVLQILPASNKVGNLGRAESDISLYFCTVCQQAYSRLTYNPYNQAGDGVTASESFGAMYAGNYIENLAQWGGTPGEFVGHYLGKHEHTFGIVKYDSTLPVPSKDWVGRDDWYYNLADELSDSFTFNLDILYREELDKWAAEVRAAFPAGMSDEDKEAKIASYETDLGNAAVAYDEAVIEAAKYEEALRQLIQYQINEAGNNRLGNISKADLEKELIRLLNKGVYSDYFSIAGCAAAYNPQPADTVSTPVVVDGVSYNNYKTLFAAYTKRKDAEIDAKAEYYKYLRLTNPDDWISACYSTIILGPAEDFCNDDITGDTLDAIVTYIENEGQVILFHDVLTYTTTNNSSTLTKAIGGMAGQNKNPLEIDYSAVANVMNAPYVPYKLQANLPYRTATAEDRERYFVSNLSWKDPTDNSRYTTWLNDIDIYPYAGLSTRYLAVTAYSDAILSASHSTSRFADPYKYADMDMTIAGFWYNSASQNAKANPQYGTNKASQNNSGIITTYPFTIKPMLAISGTHPQSYSVDLEDYDLTVWYSLAGGTNEGQNNDPKSAVTLAKQGSSVFAASPNDGADSYFLYSYRHIFYCGAGHSKITGIGKDNNDERMLYINIICNSVRKSARQPMINVYDPDSTMDDLKNNKVKEDGSGNYIIKVDDMESYPEFSFLITGDNEFDVKNIKIFYDLDFEVEDPTITNKNAYINNANHILIADWTATGGKSYKDFLLYVLRTSNDLLADPTTGTLTFKLRPEYFAPYGNKYTYIVIAVTDTKGNVYYKRIKIQLKDYLFNLT